MKLTLHQWCWLVAAAALFIIPIADIVGILEVSPVHWMLGLGLLALIGLWVMPSLKELREAQRRRP